MFMKIVSLVIFLACLVQGREVTEHLDAKLKLINKPALKSFQTENGDIIDCIDIHKQLAFDHPLLKNHQIQMNPETAHLETTRHNNNNNNNFSNYMPENVKCPPGTVPIKRATREDLLVSESIINSKGLINPAVTALSPQQNFGASQGHGYAMVVSQQRSFGGHARLNVWTPIVGDKQFTLSGMGLAIGGPADRVTTIQAGWLVHSMITPKDSKLFIFWTGIGNKDGCFNTLCPGFVQVSTEITLGLLLFPSSYGGGQSNFGLSLHQDQTSKNWWLTVDDKPVGYWPSQVMLGLKEGADIVFWGGEAYSPPGAPSPAMGSGHFPEEGYSKSAFVEQLKVISKGTKYEVPVESALRNLVNKPNCYNALHYATTSNPPERNMFFGGPGKCTS